MRRLLQLSRVGGLRRLRENVCLFGVSCDQQFMAYIDQVSGAVHVCKMGAAMKLQAEEVIVDFGCPRERVPMATEIRGGYLLSSLRSLRALGHADAYFAALPAGVRPQIEGLVSSQWYPIALALDHYRACDSLDLSVNDTIAVGANSVRFAYGSVISVAAKLATNVGVTPHTIFAQGSKRWSSAVNGSAIGIWKTGPKEARVEIVGAPFAALRYARIAIRGILLGSVEGFCKKAYAYEIPELCTASTLGYRFAWV